jgi:ATP-dependent Lon protease
VEESYTSELLQAEQRETLLRQQLETIRAEHVHVQQRLANDHTLTALRTEAEHALHIRDEALQHVTQLEDDLARAQAAQSNLQAVMEQLIQGQWCTLPV